ncbi:hypothetical protein Droror1_Dr00019825, partial [Drosera rotundifolia]
MLRLTSNHNRSDHLHAQFINIRFRRSDTSLTIAQTCMKLEKIRISQTQLQNRI